MDTNIPSWPHYFMNIAHAVSQRSKDPRTKVGSVITDSRKRIVATGYNGFAPGVMETSERWLPENKAHYVCHSEASAIAFGGSDLVNGTLYVTLHPCPDCAKLVIAAGISEVVYETTREAYFFANEMFKEAGIKVTHLPRE